MTTAFTLISLVCIVVRICRRQMTNLEWVLLAVFAGHFLLEEFQLIMQAHTLYYDARYFRPAEFLLWPWMAWGVARLWDLRNSWGRRVVVLALLLVCVYSGVLMVKPNLPIGRRGAYVAATNWAAEKIREDWKGPAKDSEFIFSVNRYRVPDRPVIDCHTARLPYILGGRSNGNDENEAQAKLDEADYWIQDLRKDDPPPTEAWELMGVFKRGKYELPLYRRKQGVR